MLENGFVKLHRSILKWEWYDDLPTKTLFLHLLLTVSIEDSFWHGIEVKRGSRVTSIPKLSKETTLSIQQVRTAISHLKATGELTVKATPKFTVVTVKNYDQFQKPTDRSTGKQQTANTLPTCSQQQYKKVKESIRKNKNREPSPSGNFSPQEREEQIRKLRE